MSKHVDTQLFICMAWFPTMFESLTLLLSKQFRSTCCVDVPVPEDLEAAKCLSCDEDVLI